MQFHYKHTGKLMDTCITETLTEKEANVTNKILMISSTLNGNLYKTYAITPVSIRRLYIIYIMHHNTYEYYLCMFRHV